MELRTKPPKFGTFNIKVCGVVRNCRKQAQSLESSVWRMYHVGPSWCSVDLQRFRCHRLRRKERHGNATRNFQRWWSSIYSCHKFMTPTCIYNIHLYSSRRQKHKNTKGEEKAIQVNDKIPQHAYSKQVIQYTFCLPMSYLISLSFLRGLYSSSEKYGMHIF